ncbi:MAG: 1-acyl-sn-glycerol-3-phosphate acyltransferase [Bacteroidales bacterium]|nr:1-acyl-sn-glycerol-3-phosphate acyltransferase [Bacteroidales bacterium]
MGKRTIDQWTWDYWLVQRYVILCYRVFYKRIYSHNLQNLPSNEPFILAPNHQNALMDALAFVCNTPFQVVFLARADIFKGKLLIHFLNYLNIIPIYRIRDGIDNVRRNDEVFAKTLQVFRNKHNPICIFPEGNHGDKRRLRQLVKGIFRMAFIAQEDYKDQPGVKIVPVGLDYGHYTNFRTTIFINYGKPIEVSEYYRQYEEDKVKAMNDLRDRLASEIRKLMIDIRNEEYYETYMMLRTIYNSRMRELMNIKGNNLLDRFNADKKMIEILDMQLAEDESRIAAIDKLVMDYNLGLKSINIRDWIVKKGDFSYLAECLKLLAMIVAFPVYLLGLINNYIPYTIPSLYVRNVKDRQFHSSMKFVLSMIFFPLYYAIVIVLAALIIPGALFSWLYILLIPVSGIFAYSYYIWIKKSVAKFRFIRHTKKVRGKTGDLIHNRKKILDLMDDIILKNLNPM